MKYLLLRFVNNRIRKLGNSVSLNAKRESEKKRIVCNNVQCTADRRRFVEKKIDETKKISEGKKMKANAY